MTKTTYLNQYAGLPSGFGSTARDSSGVALQTATQFVTQDSAASPLTSPLTYTGTTIITITIPDPAIQMILSPSTDLRVSEDPAMVHYDIIAAGAKEAFAVALMPKAYIRRDTADGTVRFRFAEV
jgi:hypothetical protein